MSHMFYLPSLKRLSLEPKLPPRLQGYRLFYYCSGRCRPFAIENGFPVLFLPGTRGSFKTIRSFASAQDYFQHYQFPSDFFAVDFNEETTALSGNIIERQAEFLSIVVDGILSVYRHSKNPPKSVMIVGHSLGILVAAHLLSNPQFKRDKITTVISLAGPLLDPIYSPGPSMDRIYERVGDYFNTIATDPTHPLLIVSLTGGSRDVLVSDALGYVNHENHSPNVLWLSTSSVSWVWASCDHLCILWCRQLMHALTFAVQDLKALSPAIYQLNVSTRLEVFRNRLITRPIRLERAELNPTSRILVNPIVSDRLPPRHWLFLTHQSNIHHTGFLHQQGQFTKIGPFFSEPEQRVLILTNHVFHDWLFLCENQKNVTGTQTIGDHAPCTELIPLSKQPSSSITWIPEYESAFARGLALLTLPLDLTSNKVVPPGVLRPGSYLVLVHPPATRSNTKVEITVETFTDLSERVQNMTDSHIPWHLPIPLNIKRHMIQGTNHSSLTMFHRIIFPSTRYLFGPSFPSLRLTVTATHCSEDTDEKGLIAFYAPWVNYFYHTFINRNTSTLLDLDVPISQPKKPDTESLFVDFFLKPYCAYRISVHFSIFQWIAKLLRLHWAHLFGLIYGHLWLELFLVTCLQLFRAHHHAEERQNKLRTVQIPSTRKFDVSSRISSQPYAASGQQSATQTNLNGYRSTSKRIPDRDPTYLTSVGVHLTVIGCLFLSTQLLSFSWSDWNRMYRYGHLGLRYAGSNTLTAVNKSIPYSFRLAAHLPFLVLSIPLALIMPALIRWCSVAVALTMRGTVYCCMSLVDWQPGSSMYGNPVGHCLLILVILSLGLVTCEALGVLIFAVHLFFKVYTCYYTQRVRDNTGKNLPGPPDLSAKPEDGTQTTVSDDVENALPVVRPLFSFYWHHVLLILIVLHSLFLVENWMDFAQVVDKYRQTGLRHVSLLFHYPTVRTADWYAIVVLFTTALTDWFHTKLCDRVSDHAQRSIPHSRHIPLIFLYACSIICAIGLFHTALMGYRLALLSSWALHHLLLGTLFHTVRATSARRQDTGAKLKDN